MKPRERKYTMVAFGKDHLIIGLKLIFMRLTHKDNQNGGLRFHNPQRAWNHFGLLTIFLVLEDHEMTC